MVGCSHGQPRSYPLHHQSLPRLALSVPLRLHHSVTSAQLRLLPDAQPLVERLGRDFFLTLPTHAGVYLLRDTADTVLYVGKAKNLRQRLSHYRVANPERLPRRLVRLLHRANRIEWEACPDETAALARERELLLSLRPPFNRAGVWPGTPKFLAWRTDDVALELTVRPKPEPGWECCGSLGAAAVFVRAALVRLLWLGLHPSRSTTQMPAGWFGGDLPETVSFRAPGSAEGRHVEGSMQLRRLLEGDAEGFAAWLNAETLAALHPFDRQVATADLDLVKEAAAALARRQAVSLG